MGQNELRFRINNRRYLWENGRLDGIDSLRSALTRPAFGWPIYASLRRTRITGLKDRHPLILDDKAEN